jgi:radical SAM superfamily enzyme YgiQ (UPF0313 family)
MPKEFNVYGDEKINPRLPHMGVAYLSAYLKKCGHKVDVYDSMIEDSNDSFFNSNLFAYDIIGFSLYSFKIKSSYIFINKLIDYLKKYCNKSILVVLGGPHITVTGKEALLKTRADFAIRGEGELTLSELLKNLELKEDLHNINGLIWRDKTEEIIENPIREFIDNIDTLPFPDYSVFKLERYINSSLNELPISTSRGCPFSCIFCAVKLIAGKYFRARSPENVIQEIMLRYKNGTSNFYISDDIFNLDIKRAEEICDLIIKNNLKIKFIFHNGLRADFLTYELANKLKNAGCTTIVLSAESGNNDILKTIKKNITIEKIISAIDILESVKINFIVNFIVGHPTETYDKAMQSISLAKEIAKRKSCAAVMFFNLIPYPATELFEFVDKNEKWLFSKEEYLNNSMSGNVPVFESKDFSREERIALLEKGNKIHRATLLRFIFGRYAGFLIQLITNIKFINYIFTKFSFNNKLGEEFVYKRFLRKLYNIK